MVDLTNALSIVTGASSGIGSKTVHSLAAEGSDVVLAARSEDKLHDIASEVTAAYDVSASVIPTDVSEETECVDLILDAVDEYGDISVLVNNAGLGLGSDVAELSSEDYQTMMSVNTDGCFYTTRAAIPHLVEGGHLIYVGSFAGKYPRPYNPVYAATKWWVRGFAQSVAAQYGGDGIGVSIVNPSEVRTGFGSEEGDPFRERFEPGTVTEPQEIADAIVYAAKAGHSAPLEIDLYRRDKLADTF